MYYVKQFLTITLILLSSVIYAEKVVMEKKDFLKLTGIAEEYVKLSKNKQIRIKIKKIKENKLHIKFILAENLKYADDFIYETTAHVGDKTIKNIKIENDKIYIDFQDKVETSTFDGKSAAIGGGIGATIVTIIFLIILL